MTSILFTDNFENAPLGVFHWNAQALVPPGWAIDMDPAPETIGEVINTGAQSGSRCVKFYAAPATETARTRYSAIFHRDFSGNSPGSLEIFLNWWEKIENLPLPGRSFFIAFMSSGRTTYGADKDNRIFIKNESGQYRLQLSRYWMGQNNENYAEVPISLQAGVWHHYQVYYKYGLVDGEYRVWFDDVEVITITEIDTTPRGKDAAGVWGWHNPLLDPLDWQIYLPKGIDVGLFNPDRTSEYVTYLDNVLIADYNIKAGPTPTHQLTINSSIIIPVTIDAVSVGYTPVAVTLQQGGHTVSVPQEVEV